MFAPRYYPPEYFPPRYFPRRGDTPDTVGGGYFTGRYFAKTYFPHRYWPGGDGTAPPVEEARPLMLPIIRINEQTNCMINEPTR